MRTAEGYINLADVAGVDVERDVSTCEFVVCLFHFEIFWLRVSLTAVCLWFRSLSSLFHSFFRCGCSVILFTLPFCFPLMLRSLVWSGPISFFVAVSTDGYILLWSWQTHAYVSFLLHSDYQGPRMGQRHYGYQDYYWEVLASLYLHRWLCSHEVRVALICSSFHALLTS